MVDRCIRVTQVCEKWGNGGIEALVMNIFRNIDNDKVRFDILMAQDKGDKYDEEIRKLGGTKKAFLHNKIKSPITRVLKNYRAFYKDLKKNKYEILHFNSYNGSVYILVFLAKLAKVPIRIVHSHNAGMDNTKGKTLKLFYHNICKKFFGHCATNYFACSEDAAKWLFNKKIVEEKKYVLVKNGIDSRKFVYNFDSRKEIREKLQIDDKFVIGNVGRFTEQKNHEFIIDVFKKVHDKKKNSILLLIGIGDLMDKMKEKVKKLGIEDSVYFLGARNEVEKYMQAMDVFLFPSLYEGLGLVAIEAQAAALKVIASDYIPKEANITNYFEHYPLDDKSVWVNRILELSNGYERKDMSDEIIDNGYDIKNVAKLVQDIYISEDNKLNK